MTRDEIIYVVREFMNPDLSERVSFNPPDTETEKLLQISCEVMGISREDLKSNSRRMRIKTTRQIIMIYCIIYFRMNTNDIGQLINRGQSNISIMLKTTFEQTWNGTAPYIKKAFHEVTKRMQDEKTNT